MYVTHGSVTCFQGEKCNTEDPFESGLYWKGQHSFVIDWMVYQSCQCCVSRSDSNKSRRAGTQVPGVSLVEDVFVIVTVWWNGYFFHGILWITVSWCLRIAVVW